MILFPLLRGVLYVKIYISFKNSCSAVILIALNEEHVWLLCNGGNTNYDVSSQRLLDHGFKKFTTIFFYNCNLVDNKMITCMTK